MHQIEKAKSLLEKLRTRTIARGATAAEAAQAAELADRIIKRYGLDDIQVDQATESVLCEFKKIPRFWYSVGPAIADHFGVKVRYKRDGPSIVFIGKPHLASVAAWLFEAIKNDIDKQSYQAAKDNGLSGGKLRSFRNEFSRSAGGRVMVRMWKLKQSPETEVEVSQAARDRWDAERRRDKERLKRRLGKMTFAQRRAFERKETEKGFADELGREFGEKISIDANAVRGQEVKRLESSSV